MDKKRLKEGQSVVAAGVGALSLYQGARIEPRPQQHELSMGN